jgi:hypothetical protein
MTVKEKVMHKTILAAAAVLALAIGAAPSFAANSDAASAASNREQTSNPQRQNNHNFANQCADILADRSSYSASEIEKCQSQQ